MGYSLTQKQTNENSGSNSGANAQRKMAAVPVLKKVDKEEELLVQGKFDSFTKHNLDVCQKIDSVTSEKVIGCNNIVQRVYKQADASIDVVFGQNKEKASTITYNGHGRSRGGDVVRAEDNTTVVDKLHEVGVKTKERGKHLTDALPTKTYYQAGGNAIGKCAEPHALYNAAMQIPPTAKTYYVKRATITNAYQRDEAHNVDLPHDPVADARCDTCKTFSTNAGDVESWPT